MKMIPIMPARQCGSCKACCEGWLAAEIHGEKMLPGKPCHYICETGCSIYQDRPKEICEAYSCLWLKDNSIPGWLKPNECNVILTRKEINGISYIEATETNNKKIDSSVLSWLILNVLNTEDNLKYEVAGGIYWVGSKIFCNAMAEPEQKTI
jgi:hypothetical protein